MNKKHFSPFLMLAIIISGMTFTMTYAMKKKSANKKKIETVQELDAMIKNNKRIAEEHQKVQKKQEKERINLELKTETELRKSYELIVDFKKSKKEILLSAPDTLTKYHDWLKKLNHLFDLEKQALDDSAEYAHLFSMQKKIHTATLKAHEKYVQFITTEFLAGKTSCSTNSITTSLLIRFNEEIQLLIKDPTKSSLISSEEEALLRQTIELTEKNSELNLLAQTLLTTAEFINYKPDHTASYAKSAYSLKQFKTYIKFLPQEIQNKWFQKTVALLDTRENYDLSNEELCQTINNLYPQAELSRKKRVQLVENDLKKLETPTISETQIKTDITEKLSLETVIKKAPLYKDDSIVIIPTCTIIKDTPKALIITSEHKPTQQLPILFKAIPSATVPYKKDMVLERVNLWHSQPEMAFQNLQQKQTLHGKLVLDNYYYSNVKCHTFCYAVDYFIKPLAIKCSWQAQGAQEGSISYNIPGQIIDHDTNETTLGVFSYGVNKDGSLFHRCFSKRAYEKISDDIKKQVYDGLFPDLTDEKTTQNQLKLRPIKTFEEYKDHIKENSFYVEIIDKKNNMTIQLFKVKKEPI